jgi:hypothetical protein
MLMFSKYILDDIIDRSLWSYMSMDLPRDTMNENLTDALFLLGRSIVAIVDSESRMIAEPLHSMVLLSFKDEHLLFKSAFPIKAFRALMVK